MTTFQDKIKEGWQDFMQEKPAINYAIPDKLLPSEEYAKVFIEKVFNDFDPVIADKGFKWIPEYNNLVKYLCHTGHKGLCLMGECGTGKSTILKYVIPIAFRGFDKILTPESCYHLHHKYDKIIPRRYILLDEVGKEREGNDFGIRYNMIANIFGLAEDEKKALFITTNLKLKDIPTKYGEAAFDRFPKLFHVIDFKTSSLR